MTRVSLEADCARCAALCCMALPFDRSDMFAFDKPGGEACRNLLPGHACRIHDSLEADGFSGCVRFDCHGAGQRVVQEVFGGRSWQDDPALIRPMSEAFRVMRHVHDLLVLLREADRLPLTATQRHELGALEAALSPEDGWDRAALSEFENGGVAGEVAAFLKGLRQTVSRGGLSV